MFKGSWGGAMWLLISTPAWVLGSVVLLLEKYCLKTTAVRGQHVSRAVSPPVTCMFISRDPRIHSLLCGGIPSNHRKQVSLKKQTNK